MPYWCGFATVASRVIGEKMVVELGHSWRHAENEETEGRTSGSIGEFAVSPAISGVRAMVFESVGPVRHEVSVPFHDSQVRGAALLIQTGWDQRWGTDAYWEPGPFLGEHLIFRMVRSGVKVVGVDFPVIEQSSETRLITTGKIPVVENLRGLDSLPRVGFRFTVMPVESASGAVCRVRAVAEIAG